MSLYRGIVADSLFLLVVISTFGSNNATDCTGRIEKDGVIDGCYFGGKSFLNVTVSSLLQCIDECIRHLECQSCNFHQSGNCELSKEAASGTNDLQLNSGYSYSSKSAAIKEYLAFPCEECQRNDVDVCKIEEFSFANVHIPYQYTLSINNTFSVQASNLSRVKIHLTEEPRMPDNNIPVHEIVLYSNPTEPAKIECSGTECLAKIITETLYDEQTYHHFWFIYEHEVGRMYLSVGKGNVPGHEVLMEIIKDSSTTPRAYYFSFDSCCANSAAYFKVCKH